MTCHRLGGDLECGVRLFVRALGNGYVQQVQHDQF
jgi:hypothetical protein